MIFSTGPLTEVGRIQKTHGYEGNVRIDIFDSIEIDFKEPLFLMFDQKPVPFFVLQHSSTNPFISKIDGIDSLEQAQKLVGKSVYLPEIVFEEDIEETFVGFTAKDSTFGTIGTVKEIIENSAQDLIVITRGDKEILIPFVDDFIIEINETHKIMVLQLPEGLLDLE